MKIDLKKAILAGVLLPTISSLHHWSLSLVESTVVPVKEEAPARSGDMQVQYRTPVQRMSTITRKAA